MLEERPLSNITVKDIVEKCGINRNSFYYHYQDIPALIEEIVKEEAEQILEKYPSVSTIVECFDALIEFAWHIVFLAHHFFKQQKFPIGDQSVFHHDPALGYRGKIAQIGCFTHAGSPFFLEA